MGFHQCADIKPNKIDCLESLSFQGLHYHKKQFVEIISAGFTLDIQDSGKILLIDTDALTLTLPATDVGLTFIIMNYGDDGDVLITISPNANDRISGCDFTTAENKDLTNTKATAKKGDYVKLLADGSDGWLIQEMVGTWAVAT